MVVAVAGASGHLGRRVVELLREAGQVKVVAVTRRPDSLRDLEGRNVVVRRGDLDDPLALVEAFAGVEKVLIVGADLVDRPIYRAARERNAVEAAVRARVAHLVYTSVLSAGSAMLSGPDHRQTEDAIAATKLDYTILRNSTHTDLFLQTLPGVAATGRLVAAAGNGGVGYVTREDCARAAAAALASREGGRRTLAVTGPAALTYADLARITVEITGRPVVYVRVAPDQLRAGLIAGGLPAAAADQLVSFDVAIAQGKLAVVSSAIRELTGRAPQSVPRFLRRHRQHLAAQVRQTSAARDSWRLRTQA